MIPNEKSLYTLIPLEDFKVVLGVDDREDKLAKFCLVTATLSIEQYCKRRLIRKKIFETVEFNGDLLLPLREYPVTKILAVYIIAHARVSATVFAWRILPATYTIYSA
jgi:hypothetical protein